MSAWKRVPRSWWPDRSVNLLFEFESVVVEVLLQHLVREVDAQLRPPLTRAQAVRKILRKTLCPLMPPIARAIDMATYSPFRLPVPASYLSSHQTHKWRAHTHTPIHTHTTSPSNTNSQPHPHRTCSKELCSKISNPKMSKIPI